MTGERTKTIAEQFDRLTKLACDNATTATWTTRGRQAITLCSEPAIRTARDLPRSMGMVDCVLLGKLRDLVSGNLPWPLFLWGPAGSGKTCAALALCDFAHESYMATVGDVCDAIMKPDHHKIETLQKHELIALDELGTRNTPSELEYKAVKMIADAREARRNRVAIYISNLPPSAMTEIYDDRIASRVLCGTIHELDGKDRRASS